MQSLFRTNPSIAGHLHLFEKLWYYNAYVSKRQEMKKMQPAPCLTSQACSAIAAVEGLYLSPASLARLSQFEAKGLSMDERREAILQVYKGARRG